MQRKIKNWSYILFLVVVLVLPYFVFAADSAALEKLKKIQSAGSGYPEANQFTAAEMAGSIVNILFSILGIIFTVLMLYGGYNWMIAAGDNAKVTKAQDTIKRAVIGLIITAGAYAIGQFVVAIIMMSRQS